MEEVLHCIQGLILFALCLFCLINIIRAEDAAGATDVIMVDNHIANISIYNLQ